MDEFLDAHVHHNLLKDGKLVPPFHHPQEYPSGPDIVFVLHFENNGYFPVFVQLKMRHNMKNYEVQHAFSTVKTKAVQHHLGEEMLQKYCANSSNGFFGAVIAYPAKLESSEGSFLEVKRSERLCSAQTDMPRCISLKIDQDNIHGLFPKHHMQALDTLQGIKRELENNDDPLDDPATKYARN
ncbi:hypothetical protein FBU30_005764 [Linnemannia zychae]|nr:hypothetical protein FBU30_005764 [Linnemannia zychae]